jgi:hypothetical protein
MGKNWFLAAHVGLRNVTGVFHAYPYLQDMDPTSTTVPPSAFTDLDRNGIAASIRNIGPKTVASCMVR